MTVMTDDSFLNLRGKEALVNIYYNIYLLISIVHRFSITVICHLSSGNRKNCPPCTLSTKRNLRGSKITASRQRNSCVPSVASETSSSDGSFKFIKFVLKIAPNRCPKFGSARKMLYLCRALGKCSASVGCGSV